MTAGVLIVDDSLTVRMDLGEAFSTAGFSPTLCSTIAEAKKALDERPYALVVIDVLLPDGDGVDLLRDIKASSPSTVVMMLSSEAEVSARLRGHRTGADEYVGKPYDVSYVIARARELIRRNTPRSAEPGSQILVIDDSVTFRERLRDTLEGAGYSVLISESGEEGLHLAADARPAAIVVDGVLPGIDGPTFIRRVREDAMLRRTPCILLTASEGQSEVHALDSGADAYMLKDEDPELMLARIGAVLRPRHNTGGTPTSSLHETKRILAVDDSMTYLQEIGSQLRKDGYDVVLASSGEEALQLLDVTPVDCVLLDVVMPGMSGYDACRAIKRDARWRDIPLIMHTSRDEQLAMIDGINAGADDYVTKSHDFQVLRARLRAQLRRRQFEDESRDIRESRLQKEMEAAESRAQRELAETRATLLAELQSKNTALEVAQHDLEAQNLRVQAANRLKSEFLANMSHELRSPLNAILGFAELLYDGQVKPEAPQHKEFLGHILTSGRHLLELINDVLDLSKVEAGKIELHPETLDPARVVSEVVSVLRTTAAQTHNTLTTDIDPSVSRVTVDAARLKQIVYNYVSNALKFTPAGGKVMVRVRPEGHERFCVEVQDTGIGIAPEHIERLFEEFTQLDQGTARKYAGTGLGLALTKRIVEAHGGVVGVRSTLGEGSTFYAVLPRTLRTAVERSA